MRVTDEMVEAGARAAWETRGDLPPWESGDSGREATLRQFRVGLEAALAAAPSQPVEGPVTEALIEEQAWGRFPQLDPDYARLTYLAEAMREYNRSAFVSGARWAAALAAPSRVEHDGPEDRVRELHVEWTEYVDSDDCYSKDADHRITRHIEDVETGEWYCDATPTGRVYCAECRGADGDRVEWPCSTIRALTTVASRVEHDAAENPSLKRFDELMMSMCINPGYAADISLESLRTLVWEALRKANGAEHADLIAEAKRWIEALETDIRIAEAGLIRRLVAALEGEK